MAKDYYKTLGVEKNASKEDIKKAFRKMAHQYHPDKKTGNEAKFKEANEAYQVLSDDSKRAQYDQYGEGFAQGGMGGGQGFGGFGFGQGGFQGDFNMDDLGDIFGDIFGGGFGGGGRQKERRGRDISTEITVTFAESIFGVKRRVLITKQSTCKTCSGSGGKPGTKEETCKKCNGKGHIRENRRSLLGTFSTDVLCDECNGSGKVPAEKCTTCHGNGVLRAEEEIEIDIPAGIEGGEMVRLSGKGEAISHGQTGDLYIKITVERHPLFKREGHNLIMDMSLKLTEALLGTTKTIQSLDGALDVKIPEGVSPNEILRVRDRGVPISKNKRGDLLIRLSINVPTKLSRKSRELVEKLKEEGI